METNPVLNKARLALGLPESLAEPRGFHRPLLGVALVCLAGLAADTGLALTSRYLPFDPPVTRAVQSVDWGPLTAIFTGFTWLEGLRQLAAALAALVVVFLVNRRAAPLMTCGALTGVWYQSMNVLIHRPRPDAQLVHVITHMPGYGYPSGHAAFFTSFSVLLLYCLGRPFLPRPLFAVGWAVTILVIATACISRIYVGAHWPSDVLAGLCIGIGWTALVLATRRLSDPVLRPEVRRA